MSHTLFPSFTLEYNDDLSKNQPVNPAQKSKSEQKHQKQIILFLD